MRKNWTHDLPNAKGAIEGGIHCNKRADEHFFLSVWTRKSVHFQRYRSIFTKISWGTSPPPLRLPFGSPLFAISRVILWRPGFPAGRYDSECQECSRNHHTILLGGFDLEHTIFMKRCPDWNKTYYIPISSRKFEFFRKSRGVLLCHEEELNTWPPNCQGCFEGGNHCNKRAEKYFSLGLKGKKWTFSEVSKYFLGTQLRNFPTSPYRIRGASVRGQHTSNELLPGL